MAPPLPPWLRGHAAHGLARAQERAHHVGREHPADARGVHLLHAHLRLENARVVDERRNGTELAIAGRKQFHDVGFD